MYVSRREDGLSRRHGTVLAEVFHGSERRNVHDHRFVAHRIQESTFPGPTCRMADRVVPAADGSYSAVVGSMMALTPDTRFAGKPPRFACSRTMASSGAMYTQ
jgi:hypothetical protein